MLLFDWHNETLLFAYISLFIVVAAASAHWMIVVCCINHNTDSSLPSRKPPPSMDVLEDLIDRMSSKASRSRCTEERVPLLSDCSGDDSADSRIVNMHAAMHNKGIKVTTGLAMPTNPPTAPAQCRRRVFSFAGPGLREATATFTPLKTITLNERFHDISRLHLQRQNDRHVDCCSHKHEYQNQSAASHGPGQDHHYTHGPGENHHYTHGPGENHHHTHGPGENHHHSHSCAHIRCHDHYHRSSQQATPDCVSAHAPERASMPSPTASRHFDFHFHGAYRTTADATTGHGHGPAVENVHPPIEATVTATATSLVPRSLFALGRTSSKQANGSAAGFTLHFDPAALSVGAGAGASAGMGRGMGMGMGTGVGMDLGLGVGASQPMSAAAAYEARVLMHSEHRQWPLSVSHQSDGESSPTSSHSPPSTSSSSRETDSDGRCDADVEADSQVQEVDRPAAPSTTTPACRDDEWMLDMPTPLPVACASCLLLRPRVDSLYLQNLFMSRTVSSLYRQLSDKQQDIAASQAQCNALKLQLHYLQLQDSKKNQAQRGKMMQRHVSTQTAVAAPAPAPASVQHPRLKQQQQLLLAAPTTAPISKVHQSTQTHAEPEPAHNSTITIPIPSPTQPPCVQPNSNSSAISASTASGLTTAASARDSIRTLASIAVAPPTAAADRAITANIRLFDLAQGFPSVQDITDRYKTIMTEQRPDLLDSLEEAGCMGMSDADGDSDQNSSFRRWQLHARVGRLVERCYQSVRKSLDDCRRQVSQAMSFGQAAVGTGTKVEIGTQAEIGAVAGSNSAVVPQLVWEAMIKELREQYVRTTAKPGAASATTTTSALSSAATQTTPASFLKLSSTARALWCQEEEEAKGALSLCSQTAATAAVPGKSSDSTPQQVEDFLIQVLLNCWSMVLCEPALYLETGFAGKPKLFRHVNAGDVGLEIDATALEKATATATTTTIAMVLEDAAAPSPRPPSHPDASTSVSAVCNSTEKVTAAATTSTATATAIAPSIISTTDIVLYPACVTASGELAGMSLGEVCRQR